MVTKELVIEGINPPAPHIAFTNIPAPVQPVIASVTNSNISMVSTTHISRLIVYGATNNIRFGETVTALTKLIMGWVFWQLVECYTLLTL